ncbi:MAG: hypothetical protein JXA78_00930 [Anaerolineales bacterium]|nr:hypothetical protein [Anaerolineales bacterium]
MMHADLYNQALEAAQMGDRQRACELLRRSLELDSGNEQAWLWLAGLSDELDEQITALERAVRLNPRNDLTRSRLERFLHRRERLNQRASAAANPDHAHSWFLEAEVAYRQGNKPRALELLLRYVSVDERNESAWYLLSKLAPSQEDRIIALENVLTLNPRHSQAQARLEQLHNHETQPLAAGIRYEQRGDLENAINQYIQASMQASSLADRLEARRRLELAQLRVRAPDYKPISPQATLLRLSSGPLLMFGILLFLHGGMRPLPILLPWFLGSGCILLGSLLVEVTSTMPLLSYWYSWWQAHGLGHEGIARLALWFLGLALLLIPYSLLFVHALLQLNAYSAGAPL